MTRGVHYGNYVGGEFTTTRLTYDDVNPAKPDDVIGRFGRSEPVEIAAATEAAAAAFAHWRAIPQVERGRYVAGIARSLHDRRDELAAAITREQGKTLAESRGEVGKALEYCDYYASLAYEAGGRVLPSARPGVDLQVRREPVGVAALITPWNVPLAIPLRKIAPALVAGCTCVLKPSEHTPLSAQAIAEAAVDAALPPGVVNIVHGAGDSGEALARDSRVRAISFTGSTRVGRALALIGAERLVKVQLELGGKNAAVVLADADLDLAAEQIALAAFTTTGQQCTATSRVLVHRKVLEAFTTRLLEQARGFRVGDGDDPEARIGPLVSARQLEIALEYVEIGTSEGAVLLLGGTREDRPGWFLGPTIFTGVTPSMRIAREEIFGPLLALIPVDSDEEAIASVNDSDYGLSAAVYTDSLTRAYRFVREAEVGAVAVNLPSAGWEVNTPFGGVKASGFGWKEHGLEALDFFTELKAVQIQPGV